jgi:threonine/homoserine/homoserine lactone efflux protein
MNSDTLIAFTFAIGLLTIAPGLDTVVVLRNSLRGGWHDGALTSLGICCGLFAHALLSAAGISLILLGSATLFTAFKLAGAAYLLWLGLRNLRAACGRHRGLLLANAASEPLQPVRSLREGLLSNLLNPKTAAFYLALLPQFIDPAGNAVAQSLLLAGIHFLLAMIWQCGLALAAGRARPLLNSARFARGAEGLLGATLIGVGLRLAVSER